MESKSRLKLTVAFLTSIILIDFMGMAIVVVLFPRLLIGEAGILSGWSPDSRYIAMGMLMAIYPLGQIFGAAALAKFSDFYGRKKLLIVTLVGTLIGFALSGIAVVGGAITLLFVSRLLSGLCAGNVAIAQAALLDLSTDATRAKNISWGQLAMGSGYIIGPLIGGLLSNPGMVSWFGMSTPFWFFCLTLIALIALTSFVFSETNNNPKKEKINLLESFSQLYTGLTSPKMKKVFGVWLMFVSGWWLFESFMPTFLMSDFKYDTTQIGTLLAYNGALYALFQYLVVQRLASKFKPASMFKYAVVFAAVSIMSLTIIKTTAELYIVMSIFVMAMGFAIPGIITFIANLGDNSEQGQIMGIVNSIQAFSTVLVMIAAGYINSISSTLSIIISGLLIVISWLYFIGAAKVISRSKIQLFNTEAVTK